MVAIQEKGSQRGTIPNVEYTLQLLAAGLSYLEYPSEAAQDTLYYTK